ncbi:hypothetical protein NHP22001_11760 [Helicobacter sp. NHP22-001]|nr:hypothetical protein NHP22001_11760 [Helicobacter sp. NHP22-001]
MNQYMGNLAKVKDPDLALKHSPNYVQFVVNMGFRTNLTKHQGFEFGVRVPTINDPYFTATFTKADSSSCGYGTSPYCGGKGSKITHTFRRNVSIYWNYVYNF